MQPVLFAKVLGLGRILEGQDGVIRRDQALAAGLTDNRVGDLVRRGRWVKVLPRVFAVGVSRTNPRVRVRAAWLWAGDSSAIAGAAAAWWWGLTETAPESIQVIVPPPARRSVQSGVQVVRGALDSRDADFEDWLRVTTVSRTCLDLARSGRPDRLENALRLRRADPPRIAQSLDRGQGRRGQLMARRAAEEVARNPWSFAERVAHRYLTESGIKDWTANPPVRLRCGTRYPDIVLEDIKLAIEIDGRSHHDNRVAFENDRARHNDFVAAGWTVLHFTWKQLSEQPELFMATVKATIDRLGGQGVIEESSATRSG